MSLLPLDAPQTAADFQLVATVTLETAALAAELARAGATSFRLNASHLEPAALRRAVADLAADMTEVFGAPFPKALC